jgi:hypothetical protein
MLLLVGHYKFMNLLVRHSYFHKRMSEKTTSSTFLSVMLWAFIIHVLECHALGVALQRRMMRSHLGDWWQCLKI